MRAYSFPTTLSLLLAAALLVGCDGYPEDWARLDRPWLSSCPDINGTYRIGENNEKGVGRSHGMEHALMFRSILPPRNAQRWHWETMTISGDARENLHITLMHSPETLENYRKQLFAKGGKGYYQKQYENMHSPAVRWSGSFAHMTDDEIADNLEKLYIAPVEEHTLKYGSDYECHDGWLTGDRLEHDPGPDSSHPRPDSMDGVVRFRKSRDNFLVAEAIHEESHSFSLWCGDGCRGFELGTWNDHDWQHWEPATPAWHGEISRPWAEPFTREHYGEDMGSNTRQQEVDTLARPLLPAGVTLVSIAPAGHDAALLTINSDTTAPFTQFIAKLEASYLFTSVRVDALTHRDNNIWQMQIRTGLKPQASSTSTVDIQLRLHALLPENAALQNIAPQDGGFMVTLRGITPDQADALVKAINQSSDFRGASVNMIFTGAEHTETRIRFFER